MMQTNVAGPATREPAELGSSLTVATRVAERVAQGAAPEELQAEIEADAELSERVLELANLGWGARRSEVRTLPQAIARLTPGTVLSLSVAPLVARLAAASGDAGLWRHSVASALAIERARVHCQRSIAPEASAAALVHDLGQVVGGASTDHAERGALLLEGWAWPRTIVGAVRFHHRPCLAPSHAARRLASLVALADAVASSLGEICGGEESANEFDPALAGSLGLSLTGFGRLRAEVGRRLDTTLKILEEQVASQGE